MEIWSDKWNGYGSAEPPGLLLAQRLRVTLWIILTALVLLTVHDLWHDEVPLPSAYLVRLAHGLLVVGVLYAMRYERLARHAVVLALLVGFAQCIETTVVTVMRNDEITSPLLLSGAAVYAATMLPWGVRPQLLFVLAAELAILLSSHALTGSAALVFGYTGLVAAILLTASVYLAYELERHRRMSEHSLFALRRSERMFRTLIENASDLITVINAEGKILYDSPAHEKAIGYTQAERTGSDAFDLIHPDDLPHVLGAIRAGLGQPGAAIKVEYRYRHKNGSWRDIEAIGHNLLDDPVIGAIVVNSRDITERRQTQEALAFSNAVLSTQQETSLDGILVVNEHGHVISYNRRFVEMWGVSPDLVAARHDRPVLEWVLGQVVDPEGFRARVDYLYEHREERSREEIELADGRTFDRYSAAMFGPQGTYYGRVWYFRDVTERRRMEQALRDSEERFRSISASAPDAIILMDSDGHVTFWNRAAEEIFGYSAAEAHGRNVRHLLAPSRLAPVYSAEPAAFGNTDRGPAVGTTQELTATRKDGTQFPVELSLSAVRLGDTWNAVGIARDVTERKRFETQLQEAKEIAEAANRAKSEFVANMSHEIRTPMNGIIGMTELALQTELTSEQREYLEMVAAAGDALMVVINDVLDFSKVEAGKLALDPVDFDVREAVGDAMRALAVRAHLKGLELAYEIDPSVPTAAVADSHRLRQIITNLVGNAIKFTEQGEVVVTVTPEESVGDVHLLHFAVRDTGIGIAPDKRETIFRPFEQADGTTTRRYGGTGLGLAISRRLVEMMGGRLWLQSAVGRGSTFHFTIACGISQRYQARRPAALVELQHLRVLVVDDNATNRRILNEMLTHWEMRPTTADSGPAAIGCMLHAVGAGKPFPLVLIDAHMPGMDGFELAERIRQMPELTGATIMMLSSADLTGEAARCRDLGVAAFLTKPLRQSELLDAVLLALGTAGGQVRSDSTPPAAPKTSVRRLRVLLAEDNPINQRLALRLLEKRGHAVTVANNGREAVAAAEAGEFDVVLMDVQMPEMDGFEATAAIRQREQQSGRHVPIVAMTAHALKGDDERCLQVGMDAYLPKPIHAEHLFGVLDTVTRAARKTSTQDECAA